MSIEQESNVVGLTPEELKPGPRTVGINTVTVLAQTEAIACWIAFVGTIEVSENVMIGTEAATLGPFQYYAEDNVLTPAAIALPNR